ncbi:hypothetical protein O3M35_006036 [Rhynocoris fuscipes]|uniref:Uncharacterized protein n=1 Tax=Rhynocoris fuscipes TaxID=488301 RepID=A0AAW1DBT1_9HEMI
METENDSTFLQQRNNISEINISSNNLVNYMDQYRNNNPFDNISNCDWRSLDDLSKVSDSFSQISQVFPKLLPTFNTEKEKMLLDAIGELQKKIENTVIKRKESESVVAQLNDRLLNLEDELNNSNDLLISKHPSENEIILLERLKNISKEIAMKDKLIKQLEYKEKILIENLNLPNTMLTNVYGRFKGCDINSANTC